MIFMNQSFKRFSYSKMVFYISVLLCDLFSYYFFSVIFPGKMSKKYRKYWNDNRSQKIDILTNCNSSVKLTSCIVFIILLTHLPFSMVSPSSQDLVTLVLLSAGSRIFFFFTSMFLVNNFIYLLFSICDLINILLVKFSSPPAKFRQYSTMSVSTSLSFLTNKNKQTLWTVSKIQ